MKALLLLLAMTTYLSTAVVKTDFSGRWELDPGQSDFGMVPETSIPTTIKLQQSADSIAIERLGEINWKETLYFDERTIATTMPNGNKRNASVQWNKDGTSMTETGVTFMETDDGVKEFKTVYVWQLAQGNMLIVNTTFYGNDNAYEAKAIYRKKK